MLAQTLKVSDLTRIETHGPESGLAKLRTPLAPLNPAFLYWNMDSVTEVI
jgi:hypothetical protein